MQNKTKNIIVVVEFVFILSIIFIINIIKKDDSISVSERRKLASFPKLTINTIFNGNASKDFETYVIDQFVARDTFKEIKYLFSINILRQKDNNKLYVRDESIYKMEYPINEKAIQGSINKIKSVCEKYLQGSNVYCSIIPDKNYYYEGDNLKIDYSVIENMIKENLPNAKYIDIKNELSVEDFYRTDIHWKQENILKVLNKIQKEMNIEPTKIEYTKKELGDFYGVYYGQVGTKIKPDTLKYLTNDTIEKCTTYNYETKKEGKVYDIEKYKNSSDKYDIFLSGATPLITINNPNAKEDKELILFRDSFGSSLAPLMIENYKKITIVDIRYMYSSILEQYISFNGQDVLFIYSGTVLNQNILK